MELLVIIILLIIFFVLYANINSSNKEAIEKLNRKIDHLINETAQIKEKLKNVDKQTDIPSTITPVKKEPLPPKPLEPIPQRKPLPVLQKANPENVVQPHVQNEPRSSPEPVPIKVKESWIQNWLRNNPDLEKFIGENLVNKIGIAVLVLGISFFVKYAIDKEWINEVGRVSIGLFCGALLTGLAHYMRNTYRSFSSVLAGGGIAVFYFTIAFAFHQYNLLSQTAAFLIMVVITSFAIALSITYNKIELAVIAAVGGFLTPFMVSTGEGNYVVLFSYLIILNAGLLVLAFFKRWTFLNAIAFLFTEIIVGGWLIKVLIIDQETNISYLLALLFVTVLYFLFLGINMVYQIKFKKELLPFDYSMLLLLTGSYFAAGITLISLVDQGQYKGLFTLGVGLVNLALAWYFFKREKASKTLLYLLIGITLTFISLTIPVQLNGHAITLFWSMEFVLLFWLYQRSRNHLFYFSSILISGLTIISLLMDWSTAASEESLNIILLYSNVQGFVTNIVAAVAFALYAQLLSKEKTELPYIISRKRLFQLFLLIAAIIAYLTAIYGVNFLFRFDSNYQVINVYHRIITEAGVLIILFWLKQKKEFIYKSIFVSTVTAYIIYHVFSIGLVKGLVNGTLTGTYSNIHLVIHLITVVTAIYLVYASAVFVKAFKNSFISATRIIWILSVLMLIFFSQEAEHLYLTIINPQQNIYLVQEQYNKAVLTIVWAMCSFGLMWLGMKYKNKTLRIISLSVFSLALLKLFFFDLSNVSEGGKIAAFILLGILLLTISFMYQKLKKMIIDDEKQ